MSDFVGDGSEMEPFPKLSDEEVDQLLAGRTPAGHEELGSLAAFAVQVSHAYRETPRPELEASHLARIVDAAQLTPDAAPAGSSRRRRTMLSVIFGTLAAKIAAVTVAAAAATSGLAATGNLPAPAQDAVAAAFKVTLGVNFPTSDEDGAGNEANNEHGKAVSETARTTDKTGREKGQEVSEKASTKSDEHRQDGEADNSGTGSPTTPSGNPTGFGEDSQPSSNPTGFGEDSQPSGNPTGYGEPRP